MSDLPQTPSFRLDGKRALVAGASSGIGRGAAVALARAGAEVICVARRAGALETLVADLTEEGLTARALVLDITDLDATAAALSQAGPVDILVNSAGTARHSAAIKTEPQDFDAVFDLNVRAAYFLSARVAEGLIAAGRPGSIINISSQMGQVGGPDRAVYCATKHAVEGFTKSMAIEWGRHGIRVNTLSPTFIRTELAAVTLDDPEKRAWVESKIQLGRVGDVSDLMGGIVFLASDAGALMTGTSLLIDGGWTAE